MTDIYPTEPKPSKMAHSEIEKIQNTLDCLLVQLKTEGGKGQAVKEITADLNAITALIERLNTLSAGDFGEYDITLEPDLTLLRDGQSCNAGNADKPIISYLERRISELQHHRLYSRYMMICFDILTDEDIDRIAHELEPLTALYALGIDPGACVELNLIIESPASPLLVRLLDGTPLLDVADDRESFDVQIPGALLVALEKYVHH